LGPGESQGGIATVMNNMKSNTPNGYYSEVINTHCDGSIIQKISVWKNARKLLKIKIKKKDIDIAHIHATHSISWWRKADLKRICKKNSIPVVIHIHSGRFEEFCSRFFGLTGYLVRKILSSGCKVVILEERWRGILRKWIPEDSIVIPNSSYKKISRENIVKEKIQILMLSRNSRGKGHKFAINILRSLESKGVDAKLIMTGIKQEEIGTKNRNSIEAKGWISEKEKNELMLKADFLIMPSEFEGSSMSVIESITNFLPCLVSPASSQTIGIDELVIPLDNVEEWSEKIISLSNQDEYDRIVNLITLQSEKYSIGNNIKNINGLYDEITRLKLQ